MSFDPNMTYWQSLKIVARELIQWPINRYECKCFAEAMIDALKYGSMPFVRLLALLTLPVSAPLCALAVQAERRKREQRRYMKFGPEVPDVPDVEG